MSIYLTANIQAITDVSYTSKYFALQIKQKCTHIKKTITSLCFNTNQLVINMLFLTIENFNLLLIFFACTKTKPAFPLAYIMVFFVFNDLRQEAVSLLDIFVIVDQPCLSFLLILTIFILRFIVHVFIQYNI